MTQNERLNALDFKAIARFSIQNFFKLIWLGFCCWFSAFWELSKIWNTNANSLSFTTIRFRFEIHSWRWKTLFQSRVLLKLGIDWLDRNLDKSNRKKKLVLSKAWQHLSQNCSERLSQQPKTPNLLDNFDWHGWLWSQLEITNYLLLADNLSYLNLENRWQTQEAANSQAGRRCGSPEASLALGRFSSWESLTHFDRQTTSRFVPKSNQIWRDPDPQAHLKRLSEVDHSTGCFGPNAIRFKRRR